MTSLRVRLPLLAATVVLSLSAWPVLADKPAWTPIAELLVGSLGEADPARMADVMTRCTALNMTLSGMAADFSEDMTLFYKNSAARFIEHSVQIESHIVREATGAEADLDVLSSALIERVKTLLTGYDQWLDDNIATGGTYFSNDFNMEMNSCHLASRFVNQVSTE